MSAIDRIGSLLGRRHRPFECRSCHERFEVEYFRCPECDGFSVERTAFGRPS